MSDQQFNVDINAYSLKNEEPKTFGESTATGFEKIVHTINDSCNKIAGSISKIFYGKTQLRAAPKTTDKKNTKSFQNPMDLGLLYILKFIASIDFCAIFTFVLNQLPPDKKGFDPNKEPDDKSPLGKIKYSIQRKAFEVQSKIDKYMSVYSGATTAIDLIPNNSETKTGIKNLISEITNILESLVDPYSSDSLVDAEFADAFPFATVLSNYINNAISSLNKFTDLRQLQGEDFKKIIKTINDVRSVCVSVQSISGPKNALSAIDALTGGAINENIRKLNEIVDPKKIVSFLSSILKVVKSIIQITRQILGIINSLRFVIKIALFLIKIFYKIKKFFIVGMQIPNAITTLSTTTAVSDINTEVVQKKGIEYFLYRLLQINETLGTIKNLCVYIIDRLNVVIPILQVISRNLNSCANVPNELLVEFNKTTEELTTQRDALQNFIDTYNNAAIAKNRTFGTYTIQIITEETVDVALSIKRRYGIALDTQGTLVVQSTPTFASDDTIIINEVKLLLSAKGLINKTIMGLDANSIAAINESLNYLEDADITIDDITIDVNTDLDPADNENEEIGLGLNAFVNKLPGGKKMRSRMRKIMAKNSANFAADLKATDPTGKYSGSLVKKQQAQSTQYQIDDLNAKISDWRKEMATAIALGPIAATAIIKDRSEKIKQAEKEISELKKQL